MINIAICDDDKNIVEELKSIIEIEIKDSLAIDTFTDGQELLDNINNHYDIIILDIEIGDMLGTNIAMELRARNVKASIFFITSYSAYISDAFKSVPFQYILKPINHQLFIAEFNRAIRQITDKNIEILVKTVNGDIPIKIKQIIFIEYINRKVRFNLIGGGQVIATAKMCELESKLEKYNVLRVHAGYMVNLKTIKSIKGYEVVLKNNEVIPISRKYLQTLRNKYARYIVEVTL